MEELISQIGNFGFPIVLSMYLLVRIEGKMEQLSTSITKLTSVLEKEK
ncbi:MAG: YvrJ family protein [Cellulosilyticaceae bacterium]